MDVASVFDRPMTDNRVNVFNINPGRGDFKYSDIYGALSDGKVSDVSSNTVTIENVRISGSVFGGYVSSGTAFGNEVCLKNVDVDCAHGGHSYGYGDVVNN